MAKEKVLHDPTFPKEKMQRGIPWDYVAPSKDQAHSGNICAGSKWGVGFRQPVGKDKAGSMESGPIPQKSVCFDPVEVINKHDMEG